MNQADSTLIRVLRTTKAQLEELGRLCASVYYKGGKGVPPPNDAGLVSVDQVIRCLLEREQKKMTRSNANSGRSRGQAGPRPPLEDMGDRAS